jgi:hypothetical protein
MPDEKDRGSAPGDINRAWGIVLGARMPVGRTLGKPLSGREEEVRLEGTVHALGHITASCGPLVTTIKCPDGAEWVIDYDEQSPYHAFAGRRVVATGLPCEPPPQHVLFVTGHFGVSTMRLVEVTNNAWLTEVGAGRILSGRFHRGAGTAGESTLSFVTETGDAFQVANNPAGATVDCTVQALAYPVRLSPCIAMGTQQHLWIICPWSYAELWGLRDRPDAGLPRDVYVDSESRQVRHRRASAEPLYDPLRLNKNSADDHA